MNQQQKFRKLKKEGKTLKQIGDINHITAERVRQILTVKKCEIHGVNYYEECKYCFNDVEYTKLLGKLSGRSLDGEVQRLSKRGRDAVNSLQRRILIKRLVDVEKMSFPEIGKKLKRHRSTVAHLYSKK